MKRILLFALFAVTACDKEVTREAPATPTPAPKKAPAPPTPIPNKLKGTTLDAPTPVPRGKVDPNAPKPYVSPLNQKPK